MNPDALTRSRALWNRTHPDLASDEILAQILDRGELAAWRELYRLAQTDPQLRQRIHEIVLSVPVALPYFWLAALASLGETIDFDVRLPTDEDSSAV